MNDFIDISKKLQNTVEKVQDYNVRPLRNESIKSLVLSYFPKEKDYMKKIALLKSATLELKYCRQRNFINKIGIKLKATNTLQLTLIALVILFSCC